MILASWRLDFGAQEQSVQSDTHREAKAKVKVKVRVKRRAKDPRKGAQLTQDVQPIVHGDQQLAGLEHKWTRIESVAGAKIERVAMYYDEHWTQLLAPPCSPLGQLLLGSGVCPSIGQVNSARF